MRGREPCRVKIERNLLMSRKRVFDIIQIGNKHDLPSRLFDYGITLVIMVNLLITFVLTFSLSDSTLALLQVIERITMILFTIEYGLRLWTADYLYPGKSRAKAICRFMVSFYGVIDLLTILPYWLPMETIYGMGAFRIIRVVRIFHLFKVNSQSDAYNVIVSVFREKSRQLASSISIIAILMLSASFLMYSVEHNAQPDVFDNAFSGLWWAVSSVLTVGYGDIYPVTIPGRLLAILICILGVMITAIPTGILSAGFSENFREAKLIETGQSTVFTIPVNSGNMWVGMRADDILEKNNIVVISVIRGKSQVDIHEAVIQSGDILICRA